MKLRVKNLYRILLLLVLSVLIIVNSLYVKSPIIGVPVSLIFFFVASTTVSDVFFSREKRFFKITLGLATFIVLTALFGSILIISARFSGFWSLVMVSVTALIFSVLSDRMRNVPSQVKNLQSEAKEKFEGVGLYCAVGAFVVFAVIGFYALATARTGEGGASVWLTIPYYFLPSFFVTSLLLVFILFFTRANIGLKLSLIFVYSFLIHSLFWIVWYPGRYGDPWTHLGESRYIDRAGKPYAYLHMLQEFLIIDLLAGRAQYALVVLFSRMLSVDIYWVHVLFVPFLWSFLVPLFSYKLTDVLAQKQREILPLVAALASNLFPTLVLWGTVSVPNSVGFIFFFFTVVLLFYWIDTGDRQFWVLSLLAAMATFLAHPQPGIFAFVFLFLITSFQKISRNIEKTLLYLLLLVPYPFALYLLNARFSFDQLVSVENFGSLQSDIVTIMLFLALLGVVWSVRRKHVRRRNTLVLFMLFVTVVLEYYLTMYGLSGLPFGAKRILVMADLLLLPLVAFGVIGVVAVLTGMFSCVRRDYSFLKKVKVSFSSTRLAVFTLLCLALSAQATITLYEAYPRLEVVELQPAAYEMEAIYYINSTASAPYVVLCDTQLASLASGLLGSDYGYGGGKWGCFGISDFDYPTIKMYSQMVWSPSLSIMEEALDFQDWFEIAYFVVSIKATNFENAIEETSLILPVDAVFGGNKLYVFRHPLPIVEEPGPSVKVVFEGGVTENVETTLSYMYETEINSTLTLSGHTSYNITDYPMHWTFLTLRVSDAVKEFEETSDINTFIYIKELEPDDVLTLTWRFNGIYPSAVWKEDSFKHGWRTHDLYPGTLVPAIATDGNILSMSYSFEFGPYQYYYYIKPVNITTGENQSIIVRWKSDGPIAVVGYYFELGLSSGAYVVPLGSESIDWTVTIVKLPQNLKITYVMVGINNLKAKDLTGVRTVTVDYILISTSS
jgi:hypothetical protein